MSAAKCPSHGGTMKILAHTRAFVYAACSVAGCDHKERYLLREPWVQTWLECAKLDKSLPSDDEQDL